MFQIFIIVILYFMGPINDKDDKLQRGRLNKQQIKARNLKQIEDIYCMFDQTINVVLRSYRIKMRQSNIRSSNSKNRTKTSKISNLQSVMDQLLESFGEKSNYSWGRQISERFKSHFFSCFQEIWPVNKQEFYQILFKKCKFDTLDFQKEIKKMASDFNIENTLQNANNSKYCSELEDQKVKVSNVNQAFQQVNFWQVNIHDQNQQEQMQYQVDAINSSILNNQFQKQIKVSINGQNKGQQFQEDSDFLPLFIKNNNTIVQPKNRGGQRKLQVLKSAKIQNSSLLIPETVFLDRMSLQSKADASDMVKFYRQLANALQQMFFSVNLISVPFKHFLYIFKETIKRKNIIKKSGKSEIKTQNRNTISQLLFKQDEEGRKYRLKRDINNTMLLTEIRDFSDAYTQFVWKYLQLYQISDSKLGKLINIDTIYGIVLKSIWNYVQWIGERGCQYEEKKLESFYQDQQEPNRTKISIQKKDYLFQVMKTLCGQRNPQKYLKKVVIFYRETSKVCGCADDLVNIYEELMIRIIKEGFSQQIAVFRMRKIVEQLLKINDSSNTGGEISYSWTTWCVLVELLYQKISKSSKSKLMTKKTLGESSMEYQNVQLQH